MSAKDRKRYSDELAGVERDIQVWDEAIVRDTLTLRLQESQLDQYVSANRPEMAEAQRRIIASQRRMIEQKSGLLESSRERRELLERLLSQAR